MKKHYLTAAALCLLHSQFVLATDLSPIVVTATRTAQTADETLASITVITEEDIERQQAQSILDVLSSVSGISLANTGGPGKVTTLFMRGAESDQILVLIDGVKAGSTSSGLTAFQDIPISLIERIEIVRGPRSSLYGSEALGGVIQIFTRKGGGDLKPSFSVGSGSHDTATATAGLSGGGDKAWFNIGLSGFYTEGFNACNGDPINFAGCFTIEPDKDGYRNLSGSLRAGYRFNDRLEIDTRVLHTDGESEFDGSVFSANESETVQQVVGTSLQYSPLNSWKISLSAGRSRDESENFQNGSFFGQIDSKRDSVFLQHDLTIANGQLLTVGLDYQDDEADTDAFGSVSRDNKGVFGQYQSAFGEHDAQLSVRWDDNEQFDDHTTGSAAWGYGLSENLRITLSYGAAFKAPSFNELYFPFFGNPALTPEKSRSSEIGLRGQFSNGHWSISLFETEIEDLIAYDLTTFAAANIEETRIQGIELGFNADMMGWNIQSNWTMSDPVDRSKGANEGNILPRRAKQSIRLDADRSFGDFNVGASLIALGKRYDNLANTRELKGYSKLDLRAEYTLSPDWRLQARLENVFDKKYETASLFNQPDRSVYLTVRYSPG